MNQEWTLFRGEGGPRRVDFPDPPPEPPGLGAGTMTVEKPTAPGERRP